MVNEEYISAEKIYDFLKDKIDMGLRIRGIDCIQIKKDGIYSPIDWIACATDVPDEGWHYHFARQKLFFNFVSEALEHDPNFYFEVFFETKEEFETKRIEALAAKEKSMPFYKKIWRALSFV